MIARERLSLREAARELDIDTSRVARLGWCLGMESHDRRIPRQDVQRIKLEAADERYMSLVHLLLRDLNA